MALTFKITDDIAPKYLKWTKDHQKVCKQTEVGAIGGKYTYSFTQTSLGCIHKLKCICGEEADFTDYESW